MEAESLRREAPIDKMDSEVRVGMIHDNDVLLGRGKSHAKHTGNRRLQDLVAINRELYALADSHRAKRVIVDDIVAQLGGRFLRSNEAGDAWFQVSVDATRIKVAQALQYRLRRSVGGSGIRRRKKAPKTQNTPVDHTEATRRRVSTNMAYQVHNGGGENADVNNPTPVPGRRSELYISNEEIRWALGVPPSPLHRPVTAFESLPFDTISLGSQPLSSLQDMAEHPQIASAPLTTPYMAVDPAVSSQTALSTLYPNNMASTNAVSSHDAAWSQQTIHPNDATVLGMEPLENPLRSSVARHPSVVDPSGSCFQMNNPIQVPSNNTMFLLGQQQSQALPIVSHPSHVVPDPLSLLTVVRDGAHQMGPPHLPFPSLYTS